MGGSAQPENGADSTTHDLPCGCVGDGNQTIMLCEEHAREQQAAVEQSALSAGKPRPTRAQITLLVLEQMPPGTAREVIDHEVAMVEMADRLGRAIHEAKKVGGPWGPACMTPKPGLQWSSDPSDHHSYCQFYRERAGCTCAEGKRPGKDDFVPVPYGFDGTGEFECDCEAMALHLVEEMAKASKLEALT